jgi:hypothetical protein
VPPSTLVQISNVSWKPGTKMTEANKPSSADSDELHGPMLTWSGDMRIAVVFSKQQAAA